MMKRFDFAIMQIHARDNALIIVLEKLNLELYEAYTC